MKMLMGKLWKQYKQSLLQ